MSLKIENIKRKADQDAERLAEQIPALRDAMLDAIAEGRPVPAELRQQWVQARAASKRGQSARN